ncbi:MAG: hypothetical protein ACTHKE_04280 [Sphingomicrobium sp.]
MTRVLVLDVPAPGPWLTANQRHHWRKKATLTALWREAGRGCVPDDSTPFTGRVRVVATIHKPTDNRWDPGNWYLTAKAALDGIVDTGLLADDSHRHVLGPDMRAGVPGPNRLVLTIEELPDA